jgi:hypothetical protein
VQRNKSVKESANILLDRLFETGTGSSLKVGIGTSLDYNGVGRGADDTGFEPGAHGRCTIHAITPELLESLGLKPDEPITVQLQEKHGYGDSYEFDDAMDAVCDAISGTPVIGKARWEMQSMGEIVTLGAEELEVLLPTSIFGPQ